MAEADMIRIEIPASYQSLETVRACVDVLMAGENNYGEGSQLVAQVRLAVHEACTNIIEHAYKRQHGSIRAVFQRLNNPARIVIHLYDQGQSFDPAKIPAPDLTEPQTSGYGLFLIRQLMDEMQYQTSSDCNHLQLTKLLPDFTKG